MLQTDTVTDFLQGHIRTVEITEFSPTVQRSGIENDMVVDMSPVCMGGYNESVPAFCKDHGQFIADPVCFFRCNFSRFE